MNTIDTDIAGIYTITTTRYGDVRGSFARLFCEKELASVLYEQHICQINHSYTAACGSVRGMHFQYAPHAETKIVRCLQGKIFDVVIDLRHGSETFLQWRGFVLSQDADDALLIPPGCAHGFQTLTDDVHLLYVHTGFYTPSAEGGVHVNDPRIGIVWPLPIENLSERDQQHLLLPEDYAGMIL